MEGVATGDPFHSEPTAPTDAEAGDRIDCVLRATGLEATVGTKVGTYQFLVGPDKADGHAGRDPGQGRQGSFQSRKGSFQSRNGFFQIRPRSEPFWPACETQETRVENGTWGTVAPAITTKS